MCLSCVCGLLCKIISLFFSLIVIVGIILLILWATGVIFVKEGNDENVSNVLRSTLRMGNGA